MAFNIRRMAAARDSLAVAMDNLIIYLPEGSQDIVAAIMRARMNDDAAANVAAIFDHFTCPQCGRVGRACQCKKAEMVA
jgi:hypothetical protein